jgi:plastocyanin
LRPRRPYLAAAVVGAALLASPAGAAAHTFTIVVDKMKFGPAPANLARGDTVMFVNKDFLRHSATASDHSFDLDLPPNAKARIVLKKSGTINYVCRYHPGMRGVLKVR